MTKLILILIIFISLGCASRTITINTEPEGAKVFVDSQEMGISPCTFPFTYYGTRHIALEKEGYQTKQILKSIKPPVIHIFPFDILVLLIPYPLEDHHNIYYKLSGNKEKDINETLKKGGALKERLNDLLR